MPLCIRLHLFTRAEQLLNFLAIRRSASRRLKSQMTLILLCQLGLLYLHILLLGRSRRFLAPCNIRQRQLASRLPINVVITTSLTTILIRRRRYRPSRTFRLTSWHRLRARAERHLVQISTLNTILLVAIRRLF